MNEPVAGAPAGAGIRQLILKHSKRANVGHIGSALSVADLLDVLFARVMRISESQDSDVFILSKGHAALALYCVLARHGIIELDDLEQYCADGSLLGVHPEHQLAGISHSTGSLGQGLSIGAGRALAKRIKHKAGRCYVLISDAELNEGSIWEAAMFSGHHRLGNLVAVLDSNGQQALGKTSDVIDLGNVAEKFTSFGWATQTVDGHHLEQIENAFQQLSETKPNLIVANTVAGKGVSYMEGKVEWHYLPMSDEQYRQAMAEVAQ